MDHTTELPSPPSPPSLEWQRSLISDVPERPFPTYDELSYDNYLTRHVLPNTPFLLSAKATARWPAARSWRRARAAATSGQESDPQPLSSSGATVPSACTPPSTVPSLPDLPALRKYSHHVVPVANTHLRCFSEFERTEVSLGQVLDTWERGQGEGRAWYVKDWHILAGVESEGGAAGEVYVVPECLRDDWLNPPFTTPDLCDSTALPTSPASPKPSSPPAPTSPPSHSSHLPCHSPSTTSPSTTSPSTTTTTSDPTTSAPPPTPPPPSTSASDFRFAYLGPPGTFTPLHRDVYASYSWSANVVGRKVWWLFAPDRLEGVTVKPGEEGELVFDVREVPGEGGGVKVLQQEGEIIFIPSGWHHQVVNLDFCISLNHNFFASPTLPRIFTAMEQAQTRVEHAISDVRDMIRQRLGDAPYPYEDMSGCSVMAWEVEWAEEVQHLLERDSGWGWKGFFETVLRNLRQPPAPQRLSPSKHARDGFVREVVGRYKRRREWEVLPHLRGVVREVEALLGQEAEGVGTNDEVIGAAGLST